MDIFYPNAPAMPQAMPPNPSFPGEWNSRRDQVQQAWMQCFGGDNKRFKTQVANVAEAICEKIVQSPHRPDFVSQNWLAWMTDRELWSSIHPDAPAPWPQPAQQDQPYSDKYARVLGEPKPPLVQTVGPETLAQHGQTGLGNVAGPAAPVNTQGHAVTAPVQSENKKTVTFAESTAAEKSSTSAPPPPTMKTLPLAHYNAHKGAGTGGSNAQRQKQVATDNKIKTHHTKRYLTPPEKAKQIYKDLGYTDEPFHKLNAFEVPLPLGVGLNEYVQKGMHTVERIIDTRFVHVVYRPLYYDSQSKAVGNRLVVSFVNDQISANDEMARDRLQFAWFIVRGWYVHNLTRSFNSKIDDEAKSFQTLASFASLALKARADALRGVPDAWTQVTDQKKVTTKEIGRMERSILGKYKTQQVEVQIKSAPSPISPAKLEKTMQEAKKYVTGLLNSDKSFEQKKVKVQDWIKSKTLHSDIKQYSMRKDIAGLAWSAHLNDLKVDQNDDQERMFVHSELFGYGETGNWADADDDLLEEAVEPRAVNDKQPSVPSTSSGRGSTHSHGRMSYAHAASFKPRSGTPRPFQAATSAHGRNDSKSGRSAGILIKPNAKDNQPTLQQQKILQVPQQPLQQTYTSQQRWVPQQPVQQQPRQSFVQQIPQHTPRRQQVSQQQQVPVQQNPPHVPAPQQWQQYAPLQQQGLQQTGFQQQQGLQQAPMHVQANPLPASHQNTQGYQQPQGYQAYQQPQGYQQPQEYQAPQGYQVPQGYQALQGHQQPQGYPAPQGYQAPQGLQQQQPALQQSQQQVHYGHQLQQPQPQQQPQSSQAPITGQAYTYAPIQQGVYGVPQSSGNISHDMESDSTEDDGRSTIFGF